MDAHLRAQLRADSEQRMQDSCTVYRKTSDTNSSGIPKPQFDGGTVTKCRWNPANGTKATEAGKVFATGTSEVAIPATTTIGLTDYINFGGRDFDILFVPPDHTFAIDLQIQVRERK